MCVVSAVVWPWSPLFITCVIGGRIITADFTKVTVLLAANQMLSKQTCCFPSKSTWCIWSAPHLITSSHTMTYWLICQRKWLNTSKNSRRKSGTHTRAFWVTTWPLQWTLGGFPGMWYCGKLSECPADCYSEWCPHPLRWHSRRSSATQTTWQMMLPTPPHCPHSGQATEPCSRWPQVCLWWLISGFSQSNATPQGQLCFQILQDAT